MLVINLRSGGHVEPSVKTGTRITSIKKGMPLGLSTILSRIKTARDGGNAFLPAVTLLGDGDPLADHHKASAVISSLMLTCYACGVEPFAWVRHVFTELPRRPAGATIDDLL